MHANCRFDLEILHINDHHSHLESDSFDYNFVGVNKTMAVTYGGFPLLVALLDELSAGKDNVIKLHAGDAITGTSFYSTFGYEADAAMMNQACFDAFVVGNHEFDGGDANLAGFVDSLKDNSTDCDPMVSVLGANVVPGEESPLQGKLEPFAILQSGGEMLGVVGIDIRGKTMTSSQPDAGTTLLDEVTSAQEQVDALVAQGVEKIILLTHVGYSMDLSQMAPMVTDVDIVVGGDSHSYLGNVKTLVGGTPAGPYPTMTTNADGEPACVVQAWEYSRVLGRLLVSFDDTTGLVTTCEGMVHVAFDETTLDAGSVEELETATNGQFVGVMPDAETTSVLADFQAQVAELQLTVIANVSEDLCFERFPGQGRSQICDVAASYNMGGSVCNIVAQAFLSVTMTAEIALQNAGGCRTDIAAGNFTLDDAFTLLPFANTLVTAEVTGAQVKALLEEGLSNNLDDGGSSGSYPYAAGLRYDIDVTMASGSRVSNIEVNPRLNSDWMPLDMDANYTLVTNSFLAGGRDGYFTFNDLDILDTYVEYAQALIYYAMDKEVLGHPPFSTFSTQRFVGMDCDHSVTTVDCFIVECSPLDDMCADMLQNGGCECTAARRRLNFGYVTPNCTAGTCSVQFN